MLKILMAYPKWDNRWLPYFRKILSSKYRVKELYSDELEINNLWKQSLDADILIDMWADQILHFWTNNMPDKQIIAYMRRYELYSDSWMRNTHWKAVDALIFVSEYIRQRFIESDVKTESPTKTYLIPNCVDLNQFALSERTGKLTQIALVCTGASHKNIGLAVQILQALSKEYTLHYIGQMTSSDKRTLVDYLENLGLSNRWKWYARIPADQMPRFYADKDFILSTSFTEGNPNNVIEGMACGCIPVVHNWPGAKGQFPEENIFNTIEQAVRIIKYNDNRHYQRQWVKDHYSLKNLEKIHNIIE